MLNARLLSLVVAGSLVVGGGVAGGEEAARPEKPRAKDVVGSPTKITVEPAAVELRGPRQFRHLLVTGHYADGTVRDLTRSASYVALDPKVAAVSDEGLVTTSGDGKSKIAVRVASHESQVDVAVNSFKAPDPFSFKNEVIASLTRKGCNSGACHGTPSGKNGFRLSLQGYLPDQDFEVLTREAFGRRTNALDPDASLVLMKGLATTPHEGGKKFWKHEEAYRVVRGWIAEGCQASPATTPALARLEILPNKRTLHNEAQNQQIVVVAHYSDGTARDVTPLVAFSTSDDQVGSVTKSGLVTFHKRGSVAILCRYLHSIENSRLTYLKDMPNFVWSNPPENNVIDKHVFAKLRELQMQPSELCADEEFIRRLHLDAAGIIPTSDEVKGFLADKDAAKRSKLIDAVLERDEYADFWALKWADVLRNTRKNVAYRGAHNYRRYLVDFFDKNRPFDQLVTELLTSTGDTMVNPAANYYRIARDPQDCAETTAQLFLGVRMQCAKCHNHPFERWTQDDYYGFSAFFARVKYKKANPAAEQEVVFLSRSGEVNHLRTNQVMLPTAPGEKPYQVAAEDDRRVALAQWLTRPGNPFFARSIVNRMWYHLFGKGIVDPVDDFRESNPACNDELLNALAKEFVDSRFDFKKMIRMMLNSRVYQLSAKTNAFNAEDERYFSRCYTKLLSAEQLLDALCSATGVPEKFAGMPLGTRAIQLPDAEFNHQFLQAFGQPSRELSCECARESDSTLNQALNLINGDVIHTKLRSQENRISKLVQANMTDDQIIGELYYATLSRPATAEEIKIGVDHIKAAKDRRRGLEDVHWALLNCKEFLFRH